MLHPLLLTNITISFPDWLFSGQTLVGILIGLVIGLVIGRLTR